MDAPGPPHVVDSGQGPCVVLLHSNAASSSQWGALVAGLADRFRVLAPDLWGSGRSPRAPEGRLLTLGDELELLEPVFREAGERFFIVGHSYGAAVGLKAATRWPQRVAAMALYEPTLFALVEQALPDHPSNAGIRKAVREGVARVTAGDLDGAARAFIDYWMGAGAWDATAPERKGRIAATMVNLPSWLHALTTEPTRIDAISQLRIPTLLMRGSRSPQSAQGVADLLAKRLHAPETITFDGAGHMGPLTHTPQVNAAIASFLDRHAAA